MENLKHVLLPVLLAITIFVGFSQKPPVVNVTLPQETTVGAIPGTELFSPFFTQNGLTRFAYGSALKTGTTTICAFPSPSSTSTLAYAGVSLRTSSTTASVLRISKAANPFATTTLLASINVAANAQAALTASTTPTSYDANVFAPRTYIVFSMSGGNGTFSPTGTCSAEFNQI